MKTYESIQEAIAGDTIEHSKALGLSTSMIHKWQEPSTDFSDSGSFNPLDRTITIIHTSLRRGRSKNPYAPLHCLAASCNHVAIPLPKTHANLKELTIELLDAVQGFSALAEEAAKCMADDNMTKREAERISDRANKACREIMEFVARAKEAAK